MGKPFQALELDEMPGGHALRVELAYKLGGRTSLPAVFVDGEFVGGCNDGGLGGVVKLHKKGELKPLVEKALAKHPGWAPVNHHH
eukprot:CAMPEP_0206045370 /NCGR_PEP_ID=MMETSP1466-20131121/15679_1 /ASSEMBLY_ACC=CAM_ASM_001126 /TAXON_ID=44452 /ORGANISM="Pavlova gyrans, Strain CCMP608" /LENGTH=84 /DNA_ID=CAMNT_0053420305 /DNA_START=45 /DNA_END=299 /DNA_ORIENTATION=-